MKFVVLSIFPEMLRAFFQYGVIKKGIERGAISIELVNIRDFAEDKHARVDDSPFGGGDGMVFKPEPLFKCIRSSFEQFGKGLFIYLSPGGIRLDHGRVLSILQGDDRVIYLLCGRYAGVDQRVIDEFVDLEISIGDYVLSGGELPAMVLLEAVSRHIEGVLGNVVSAAEDSFVDGLLEGPIYTRPAEFEGRAVPDILLSGDHEKIKLWRHNCSLVKTKKMRPDLLKRLEPNDV